MALGDQVGTEAVKAAGAEANELLSRIKAEELPAIGALVDHASEELSTVIHRALIDLADIEGRAVSDLRALLAGLDGWTATITVPPITIKLTRPPA